MAIKKYRPLSPDPYVGKIKGDTEFARLAHLNDLVDQVNNTSGGGGTVTSVNEVLPVNGNVDLGTIGTVTSVNNVAPVNGNVTLSIPSTPQYFIGLIRPGVTGALVSLQNTIPNCTFTLNKNSTGRYNIVASRQIGYTNQSGYIDNVFIAYDGNASGANSALPYRQVLIANSTGSILDCTIKNETGAFTDDVVNPIQFKIEVY